MIEFLNEAWRTFRAENGAGCRLRCPWAMLAVVVVVVFYCVAAPLRALVGWIGRQVHCLRWLQRFEFPTRNIFFATISKDISGKGGRRA